MIPNYDPESGRFVPASGTCPTNEHAESKSDLERVNLTLRGRDGWLMPVAAAFRRCPFVLCAEDKGTKGGGGLIVLIRCFICGIFRDGWFWCEFGMCAVIICMQFIQFWFKFDVYWMFELFFVYNYYVVWNAVLKFFDPKYWNFCSK